MLREGSGTLLDYLRALSSLGGDVGDVELLDHFVTGRDGAAFEALVRRHGPMVWGVCRRVLGNGTEAEDAFQVTFLVLIRKARSIGRRELLANWLYGVAVRTASKARVARSRRRAREQDALTTEPPAPTPAEWTEIWPVLDEELTYLPQKYRQPVVLCFLEGMTRTEAARRLGWPPGTVAGRLARALDRLRSRLAQRGVVCAVGVLATLLESGAAAAAVPMPLLQATVTASAAVAGGKLAAAAVSTSVAQLMRGVIKAMWLTRLKVALVVLALVIATGAAGFLVHQALNADGEPAAAPDVANNFPAAEGRPTDRRQPGPGKGPVRRFSVAKLRVKLKDNDEVNAVAFSRDGQIVFSGSGRVEGDRHGQVQGWDAAAGTKEAFEISSPYLVRAVAVSPDGSLIAMSSSGILQGNLRVEPGELRLFDAATSRLKADLLSESHSYECLAFSPDGKILATGSIDVDARGRPQAGGVIRLWDVARASEIALLTGHKGIVRSVAFSRDGKTLASASGQAPKPGQRSSGEVKLWDVAARKEKASLDGHDGPVWCVACSHDGNLVASGADGVIRLWDATQAKQVGALKGHKGVVVALAFSPDGKTLASGGGNPGEHPAPGELKLWDVPQRKAADVRGHDVTVTCLAFDRDGRRLASGSRDGGLFIWDVISPPRLFHAEGGA